MVIGEGRHSDLIGMSYGDLYDTFLSYDKIATLSEVPAIMDARMAAWKLAKDNGANTLDSRMAGLKAAIVKARELGL